MPNSNSNPNCSLRAAPCAFEHKTVLLNQAVAGMLGQKWTHQPDPDAPKTHGIFVDATFGRGGHSRLLLECLDEGSRLIVIDKDQEAIAAAWTLAKTDARVVVVHDSFANIKAILAALNIDKVDGILADLGVSSPQLDDGSRGFSFMKQGAVDMRMDTTKGEPVSAWLQRVSEEELANVLYEFGEERHSRRIACAIKAMKEYNSTLELAETIKTAHPAWQKGKHPATQSFQAMRIFINNELADIDVFLQATLEVLAEGGHLALISFHSLEDRRIKRFFNNHSRGRYEGDEKLPIPPPRPKYFAKPVRIAPADDEIKGNPRARSAYLRIAQRTNISYTTQGAL